MTYSPTSLLIAWRYYPRIIHIHSTFSYHYIHIPIISHLEYPPLFNLANTYSSFCTQLRYYPLHTVFSVSPKLSKALPCYPPYHFVNISIMALPVIPIHESVSLTRLKTLRRWGGETTMFFFTHSILRT